MHLIINPNKGISAFNIGEKIDNFVKEYDHVFSEGENDIVSWDEYDFFDGALEVYVAKKEKTIESLCCRKSCYLDSVELIGLPYDEFLTRFNLDKEKIPYQDIWLSNSEKQRVYDVDDFSLQLWVDRKNIITTVFLGY